MSELAQAYYQELVKTLGRAAPPCLNGEPIPLLLEGEFIPLNTDRSSAAGRALSRYVPLIGAVSSWLMPEGLDHPEISSRCTRHTRAFIHQLTPKQQIGRIVAMQTQAVAPGEVPEPAINCANTRLVYEEGDIAILGTVLFITSTEYGSHTLSGALRKPKHTASLTIVRHSEELGLQFVGQPLSAAESERWAQRPQ